MEFLSGGDLRTYLLEIRERWEESCDSHVTCAMITDGIFMSC